ncbi:MAG: Rieske 2Fe-2S domain-containing protein [Burkholderiaceae bacterium]
MLNNEQNELLTRVEGSAPMGRMLRENYWVPAIKSGAVVAGGAPVRVRLLGSNYVLFRTTDGRLGCVDERCPHRGVSLALARNEGDALRCIFHGWAFTTEGNPVEVPTQVTAPERFAKSVKTNRYHARDAGGMIWLWLGAPAGVSEPSFPDFEFLQLPLDQISIRMARIPANWFQGVEANQDSSHVGILHKNFVKGLGNLELMAKNPRPVYDVKRTRYGHQAATLRDLDDGRIYLRLTEYVMPWYSFVTPIDMDHSERILIIAVPVDDTHMNLIYVRYDTERAVSGDHYHQVLETQDLSSIFAGEATNWGQDRAAMLNDDNFSGFHNLVLEDVAVQLSMGAIADRAAEQLCSGDRAIVMARQIMVGAVTDYLAGKVPDSGHLEPGVLAGVRTRASFLPPGADWQTWQPPKVAEAAAG